MHRISGFRPQNLVLRPSSKPRPRVAPELFSPSSQEIGYFFFCLGQFWAIFSGKKTCHVIFWLPDFTMMFFFLPDFISNEIAQQYCVASFSSEEIFVGSCVARGVLDPVFPGDLQPGEWTSGDSKDAGRPWVLKGFPSQSFVDYTP